MSLCSLSQSRFSGTMEALEEDKCEGGHPSSESLAPTTHEITFPCSAKLFRALWHQIMDCWGQRNGGEKGECSWLASGSQCCSIPLLHLVHVLLPPVRSEHRVGAAGMGQGQAFIGRLAGSSETLGRNCFPGPEPTSRLPTSCLPELGSWTPHSREKGGQ